MQAAGILIALLGVGDFTGITESVGMFYLDMCWSIGNLLLTLILAGTEWLR